MNERQPMIKLVLMGYIVPYVFFIVGSLIVYSGMRTYFNASASTDWPQTLGVVTSSAVREDHSSDPDGVTYHADVVCEYILDGEKHSTDVVHFGERGASWSSHAENIVERYPVGKRVQVFYDPSDHENAVLEPGTSFMMYFIPVIGLFAMVPGGWMILNCPKIIRNEA